jgi:Tfp pilus assembly protein PilN
MRVGFVVSIFSITLFIMACIGLLPSYLSEKIQTENALTLKNQSDAENSGTTVATAEKLKSDNQILADYLTARIPTLKKGDSFSLAVDKVLAEKSSAITLDTIQFDGQNMSITGVAATRNDLISFNNALQSESYFKGVSFPISDIAKKDNADFSIQITLP